LMIKRITVEIGCFRGELAMATTEIPPAIRGWLLSFSARIHRRGKPRIFYRARDILATTLLLRLPSRRRISGNTRFYSSSAKWSMQNPSYLLKSRVKRRLLSFYLRDNEAAGVPGKLTGKFHAAACRPSPTYIPRLSSRLSASSP